MTNTNTHADHIAAKIIEHLGGVEATLERKHRVDRLVRNAHEQTLVPVRAIRAALGRALGTTPTRRTKAQVAADRAELLSRVALDWSHWVKLPDARQSDLEALVRDGKLVRKVEVEYDHQRMQGANSALFGGAGMVRRQRAYYAVPVADLGAAASGEQV